MKISLLLLAVCLFGFSGQDEDYCNLQGAVFIEKTAAFADYRVFIEPTIEFADLRVYKEEVASFADEAGVWYFTEVKDEASFSIYLEDSPNFADFSLAYTRFRTDAGCH
jgi:hypothetical protein